MKQYRNEWILLSDIEEVYEDIAKNSLEVTASNARKKGEDVSKWYKNFPTSGGADAVRVNVGYLKYVWEKRRKIQFQAQDKYFEALELYSETKLLGLFSEYTGRSRESLWTLFNKTLFANTYYIKLSDMRINKTITLFNNFCDELLEPVSFDNVKEEYDYYEAKRILNKIQGK